MVSNYRRTVTDLIKKAKSSPSDNSGIDNGKEPLYFKSRALWRRWLQKNYATHPQGVWLLFYKKATAVPSISLMEATEEALCFGWIDGQLRRIDDEKHKIKYVPRRKNSIWSLNNRMRAERLIKEGKMMPPGMVKIEEAKKNGNWDNAYSTGMPQPLPDELKKALAANHQAKKLLESLPPSRKFQYIYWINDSKTGATQKRRIAKVIELLKQIGK